MTTVLLRAVASKAFLAGPYAGPAFFALALFDSRFLLPKLFPPPDAGRPSVGDHLFQGAEDGTTVQLLLGPEAVSTGCVIWLGPLILEPVTADSGGCGGGGPITGYNYFRHAQIAIGECPDETGIDAVLKVWKDSEVFYERDTDVAIASNLITAVVHEVVLVSWPISSATNANPIEASTYPVRNSITDGMRIRVSGCLGNTAANGSFAAAASDPSNYVFQIPAAGNGTYVANSGNVARVRIELELQSPSNGPDLSRLRIGQDATIGGFTAPATADNGTFRVTAAGTLGTGGTFARFDNENAVAKANGDSVTVDQLNPQFDSNDVEDIEFTNGSDSEVPAALVEGIEGVGNVPAYRRLPTMVVQHVSCDQTGRIGEFRFLTRVKPAPYTRADAISALMVRAGFDSDEFDVEDVSGDFRGYGDGDITATTTHLGVILVAYDQYAQGVGEVIRFFDHAAAKVIDVPTESLGAYAGGDVPPQMRFSDPSDSTLPDRVVVNYIDPKRDWQSGSQRERRSRVTHGEQREEKPVGIPLVMEGTEARGIAIRIDWQGVGQKRSPVLSLPPSELSVLEGDILTIDDVHGDDWRLLVRKTDIGANWIMRVEAQVDDPELATITDGPADDPGGVNPPPVDLPGGTDLVMADLPPLLSAYVGKVGFYWGAALSNPAERYQGMNLFVSTDAGVNYSVLDTPQAQTTLGRAQSVLPGTIGSQAAPVNFFDMLNTVDVELEFGTLSSSTRTLVLGGANRAVLGNEVIAFLNATALTTVIAGRNRYRLSGLLRGLYNTRDNIGRHFDGEGFMLLNNVGGMRFVEIGTGQLQNQRPYKAVPVGAVVTQAAAFDFSVQGACVSAWAPVSAKLRKDTASGDLTLIWGMRFVGPVRLFATGSPAFDSLDRVFEIEIWDSGFTTLKRTLSVSGATEVVYYDANQTFDFGSSQTTVSARIYQMHSITGRSKPLQVNSLATKLWR